MGVIDKYDVGIIIRKIAFRLGEQYNDARSMISKII